MSTFLCVYVGVVKMANRLDKHPFTVSDQNALQAFASFCGLGISIVMNFEAVARANAKQSVALEILSYHASSSIEDVARLMVR